ncbi:MAG: STT3 domain-containing protein [Nanoarchaeota archaeon]|nr:STT3 domain-containing protein [Nanoarchaeota archaeon]
MEEEDKREKLVKSLKNAFSKVDAEDSLTSDEKKYTEDKIDLEKQRLAFINFFKKYPSMIAYFFLAIIIWFGSYIRLRNLWLLKDTITGKYVPLALDPHSFLRYAKYIVEHGFLVSRDMLRFVPVGRTTADNKLLSYAIVYFYKFLNFFNPNVTLEYADVIYPVIAFAIGLIFFYLLVKKIFNAKVAILSTLFLAILPAFLYRTMAGFSDKEPLGTLFMFAAMYFFVTAYKSKTNKTAIIYGLMAGAFTGLLGLTWGGVKFVLMIVALYGFIEFILQKFEKKDFYTYTAWLIPVILIMGFLTPKFGGILGLIRSVTSGAAILVFVLILIDYVLFKLDILRVKEKIEKKIPLSIATIIIGVIFGLIIIAGLMGPQTLAQQFTELSNNLLRPLGTDRWMLTVAEQHQPFFTDWQSNFKGFFWMFFLGSIWLFYELLKPLKKHKITLTTVYALFISGFIFSRYARDSILNGTNTISKVLYIGSLVIFGLIMLGYYFYSYYKDKNLYQGFRSLDKSAIFTLIWFIVMVIAARGAIRLLYVFAPITAILGSYFLIQIFKTSLNFKDQLFKFSGVIIVIILISVFAMGFSKTVMSQSKYTGPSYNQQWQTAGDWIKQNTPLDSVFGHWWDYGYWVQTGGERATMLDGGNSIVYWNYLMGRYGLGAQNQNQALELFNTHNVTHFLIINDEIGKYTAYSSIGSDKDFDRYSWITTFSMDNTRTQETRNQTIYFYQGSYILDDDIIYDSQVFAAREAGIGGIFIPVEDVLVQQGNDTIKQQIIKQPYAGLINKGSQVNIPIECLYIGGRYMKFPEPGLKGCFRLMPSLDNKGQVTNPIGTGLYISEEGVNALWTQLYLFEQNNPEYDTSAFKLAYNDEEGMPLAFYQGRIIGPIKIWEIEYPENFTVSPELKEKYLGGNDQLPDYFFDV